MGDIKIAEGFVVETNLMGDDDMEKTAVYLGGTLEWCEDCLGVRPDRRHVRSQWRELGMETCRSVSTPLSLSGQGRRSD